jgi:hypothetical protein
VATLGRGAFAKAQDAASHISPIAGVSDNGVWRGVTFWLVLPPHLPSLRHFSPCLPPALFSDRMRNSRDLAFNFLSFLCSKLSAVFFHLQLLIFDLNFKFFYSNFHCHRKDFLKGIFNYFGPNILFH